MKYIRVFFVAAIISGGILLLGNSSQANAQNGMEWRGTVDDHVQIVIRNQRVNVRTLSGTAYYDQRTRFDGGGGRWRNGSNYRASVDKQDGRGKVWVLQQPNRRNDYTTIIQVDDPKGGPDRYRFYVRWD